MEDKRNIISAIDIGTTKIICIIAEKLENGKIKILGLGNSKSTGVKRGVVQNIPKTKEAVLNAVKQAEEQAGITIKDVYVGIAGQHIRSTENSHSLIRENAETEISIDEIDKLKEMMFKTQVGPGEEVLHVIPKTYIVDQEMDVEPLGMFGQQLTGNFHIVIGQTTSAKNIKKCINEVNDIQVNDLILEPLASSYAVVTDEEKEVGVALIDIGGGTTDIAVFHNNKIVHTAVIPLGGDVITKDIKEAFKIIELKAEQLKIQFGSALPDTISKNDYVSIKGTSTSKPIEIPIKSLAQVISARVNEILDFVYYQISENIDPNDLGAGIVLTGGGALLRNLSQFVAFKTGLQVRLGYPQKSVVTQLPEALNQTKYATSIGLILKGFELDKDKQRREESWQAEIKNEEQKIEENIEEQENTEEENIKETSEKQKSGGFLGNLKVLIKDVFTPEEDEKLE